MPMVAPFRASLTLREFRSLPRRDRLQLRLLGICFWVSTTIGYGLFLYVLGEVVARCLFFSTGLVQLALPARYGVISFIAALLLVSGAASLITFLLRLGRFTYLCRYGSLEEIGVPWNPPGRELPPSVSTPEENVTLLTHHRAQFRYLGQLGGAWGLFGLYLSGVFAMWPGRSTMYFELVQMMLFELARMIPMGLGLWGVVVVAIDSSNFSERPEDLPPAAAEPESAAPPGDDLSNSAG